MRNAKPLGVPNNEITASHLIRMHAIFVYPPYSAALRFLPSPQHDDKHVEVRCLPAKIERQGNELAELPCMCCPFSDFRICARAEALQESRGAAWKLDGSAPIQSVSMLHSRPYVSS